MKKVKITLGLLALSKLLVKAKDVKKGLTNNTRFPNLPFTLVELAAEIALYEAALEKASDRSRVALAALRKAKARLAKMLRSIAEYVNTTASGDEEALLSSGFDVTKTPEKHQLPGEVEKINARFTNIGGTIVLEWERSLHAKSYMVLMSSDNGATFSELDTTFTRKLLVDALTSGKRYFFKVVPINQKGEGPESDVASQIAA